MSYLVFYSMVSYLYVSYGGSITSVGEERAKCLLSFTCNYVVSVRRDFLFLWVLGMDCVILLWHSLSLPYNVLGQNRHYENMSMQYTAIFHGSKNEKFSDKKI